MSNINKYISQHICCVSIPDITLASFYYGEEKITLNPSGMIKKNENEYTLNLENTLLVTLQLKQLPEQNAADWVVRFKNISNENSKNVSQILGMDLSFPVNEDLIYGSLSGDSCDATSFVPFEKTLTSGMEPYVRTAINSRCSSLETFPYFDISNGSNTVFFAVGWTGKWQSVIEKTNNDLLLNASMPEADFYLYPGEEARSVRIVIFGVEMPADDARRAFVRFHRDYYSPRKTGDDYEKASVRTVCSFDRYYWSSPEWAGEEIQKKIVESLKNTKCANTYWFDAAWYQGGFIYGTGNYRYNDYLPNGLMPVTKLAHKYGLKCVLWFEPEGAHYRCAKTPGRLDTDTYLENPDWIMKAEYSDTEGCAMINFGIPEARKWVFENISKILAENEIDIYRQDYNQEPINYFPFQDLPGRKGLTEIHHIEGIYKLWDDIRERFPNIIIDNCSSGGRRLDIELLSRSIVLWRSDTSCGPCTEERPTDIWNQNQTLALSRYIPYHQAGIWDERPYMARSAGTRGLNITAAVLDEDYKTEPLGRAFCEIERQIPLWDGDFYELTGHSQSASVWSGYQLHDEKTGKGLIKLFRRKESDEASKQFKINAIDPGAEYIITFTDEDYNVSVKNVKGAELLQGYEFKIEKAGASLVAEYQKS